MCSGCFETSCTPSEDNGPISPRFELVNPSRLRQRSDNPEVCSTVPRKLFAYLEPCAGADSAAIRLGPRFPRSRLSQNSVSRDSIPNVIPAKEAVAKVRHAREGGHPCECVGLHKVVAAWPPGCRRQTRVEELGAPMNAWLRKIGRRTRRRLRGLATLMDSRVRGNDEQARCVHDS